MSQITTAKIVEYDGCNMLIIPQEPISREMIRKQVKNVELRLCDGRECTSEQRRKIFAIIGEIADWSGHDSEDLSILQVLCKYKIVQKNLFKWTELNSVRFYVIRKISTCQ